VAETLDSALKERLRAVLDTEPVTEAELRKLAEKGRACLLIMAGELRRNEERLTELGSDPASSLTEVAACLRCVNELRPDLRELETLLAELEGRAREFRASWLATAGYASSPRSASTSARNEASGIGGGSSSGNGKGHPGRGSSA
jgi:hypothetical protein